jgi:hypothetical protein
VNGSAADGSPQLRELRWKVSVIGNAADEKKRVARRSTGFDYSSPEVRHVHPGVRANSLRARVRLPWFTAGSE